MNAPLLLMIATVTLALLLGGARLGRVPAAILAGGGCLTLGALSLLLPLDVPVDAAGLAVKFDATFEVLGRALQLAPGIRSGVGFLFLVGGYMFLGGMVADPGRYFFSMGVVAVGLLAASLMVRPFLYSAVLIQLAAAAFVMVLSPPDRHAERCALRLLAFMTLGMMAVLMAAWLIERLGVTAGSPEQAGKVLPILGLGMAVVLFVPPFHLWLPPGADRSHPYAVAATAGLMQATGLFLVLRTLDSYVWVREDPGVQAAMTVAGVVMIVLGGVWALSQTRMARTVVYVLLVDLGIGLLALGSSTAAGYQLAMGMSVARVVGLGAWGLGAAVLGSSTEADDASGLGGTGFSLPLPAILSLAGLLSIAGFPLTAGFPGKWGLTVQLLKSGSGAWWLVPLGVVVGVVAGMQWLAVVFGGGSRPSPGRMSGEGRVLVIGGIVLILLLGVFPQLVYPLIIGVISGLQGLFA